MENIYVYYVFYEAWKDGEGYGKGNCEIGPINQIASIDDIANVENSIKQSIPDFVQNDVDVLILSYQLLRVEA